MFCFQLVVTLTDENDNSPEFTVASQSVPISEGADPGRIVVVLSAMDEDDGTNAALMYFITGGNNEGSYVCFSGSQSSQLNMCDKHTVLNSP